MMFFDFDIFNAVNEAEKKKHIPKDYKKFIFYDFKIENHHNCTEYKDKNQNQCQYQNCKDKGSTNSKNSVLTKCENC